MTLLLMTLLLCLLVRCCHRHTCPHRKWQCSRGRLRRTCRDLSKPVGALTPARLATFRQRFEEMPRGEARPHTPLPASAESSCCLRLCHCSTASGCVGATYGASGTVPHLARPDRYQVCARRRASTRHSYTARTTRAPATSCSGWSAPRLRTSCGARLGPWSTLLLHTCPGLHMMHGARQRCMPRRAAEAVMCAGGLPPAARTPRLRADATGGLQPAGRPLRCAGPALLQHARGMGERHDRPGRREGAHPRVFPGRPEVRGAFAPHVPSPYS